MLTINRAVLTVTSSPVTMIYGAHLPTLSAEYSDFVNGETATVLSGAPLLSTTATSASNAGTYPINVAQANLSAQNYTFNFVSGSLRIEKAILAVMAEGKTMNAGDPVPALTASYSGFLNGDTSTALSGAPSLTTSESASSAPGTYSIVVSQGTLNALNYSSTFVNGTLTIKSSVWTAIGFYEPVTMAANAINTVKGGSTVPGPCCGLGERIIGNALTDPDMSDHV